MKMMINNNIYNTSSNLLPYSTPLQPPYSNVNRPLCTLTTTNSHQIITKSVSQQLRHSNNWNRSRSRSRTIRTPAAGLSSEGEGEAEAGASAIEAVSEIIMECCGGRLTIEECYEMAVKSPKYVQMLIDGVHEFETTNNISTLKERVYEMGQQKGDKGIAPFLESSFGMSLPSAMHFSRLCLASKRTLPHLIVKVSYLKEMLFSDDCDEYCNDIGKIARRMMMRLSISVDDDALQQTLAFFEKTQARRGGLNLLGFGDASFRQLIQSFPRILLLPLETRIKPMIKFLEDTGVPKRCMRKVVLLYPPILFYDIEKDIQPAYIKVKAEKNEFGRILLKYPWILSSSIQRNYEEIHSFFDTKMVPKSCVDIAVKSWPQLLGCSVDKMKVMVKQFTELGISNKKLGQVIAKSPQLLLHKPQDFLQVVDFLKELGLDEETVGRVLGRCPEIFATDIDIILRKKIEFLNSIGVYNGCIPHVIRKYPELFVGDIGNTLHPRMMYLREIGLSKKAIASMVSKFSPILGYSVKEVLKPKSEFLVNTMGKPLSDVVDYPRYYSYSMEKKIEPRYWELRSRNVECSLKDMLSKNDEEFAAEFMSVQNSCDPVS